MDNTIKMKSNGSHMWPYVIVGSAIGGAVGYLFMTESGRRIRHSLTHPDKLADDLDEARNFIERKARVVTDKVHGILQKAKQGIEEGERGYHEAGQQYRTQVRQIDSKNNEITSSVHNTVDKVNRTALTIEQSVLDPIAEIGALYKGIERGIRTLLGKSGNRTSQEGPIPIYRDQRVTGS